MDFAYEVIMIMKKTLLLLICCVHIVTTAFAKDFLLPDYEGIQAMGQSNYNLLLNRFQAQDTTLSIQDFQSIYYGSAFYGAPSSGMSMKRLNAIYEADGNEGVIIYVDSLLSESPQIFMAV